MNSFQSFNDVSNYFNGGFSCAINGSQQSTLWICNTDGQPISTITLDETTTSLVLHLQTDPDAVVHDIRATPETILIRGEWKNPPEGALCLGEFESLIPLPYPVYPSSLQIDGHKNSAVIQLEKQLDIQPSMTRLVLTHPVSKSNL